MDLNWRPEFFLENGVHRRLRERLDWVFSKLDHIMESQGNDKKEVIIESGSRQIHVDIEDILYIQAVKYTYKNRILILEGGYHLEVSYQGMKNLLGSAPLLNFRGNP